MMANYAQMPTQSARLDKHPQSAIHSPHVVGKTHLGVGNELSPNFHKSPLPVALAGPIVNHFHCVWINV
jgi:hypothetical protein